MLSAAAAQALASIGDESVVDALTAALMRLASDPLTMTMSPAFSFLSPGIP